MKKIAVTLPMKNRIRLRDSIKWACVIAHEEDTSPLEKALGAEGFWPETQRLSLSPEEMQYSAIIRCFLNHRRAWERASQVGGLSLIVEAQYACGSTTRSSRFD